MILAHVCADRHDVDMFGLQMRRILLSFLESHSALKKILVFLVFGRICVVRLQQEAETHVAELFLRKLFKFEGVRCFWRGNR